MVTRSTNDSLQTSEPPSNWRQCAAGSAVVGAIRDEAVDGLSRGLAVPLGQPDRASELATSRRPAVEVRVLPKRAHQHSHGALS